jgi:hypothetical protein
MEGTRISFHVLDNSSTILQLNNPSSQIQEH